MNGIRKLIGAHGAANSSPICRSGGGEQLVAGGSTSTALELTTATLLPSCQALVAGSMRSSRNEHTATLPPSGKVLIAGGVGGETTA